MKRYLLIIATLTLGICLAVALFNYRVDPYSIYHFEKTNADRLNRIDQFWYMRVTKPWHVLQIKPKSILLGSSRTASVRPYPTWPEESSYNLSVPGMTVYEMLRFIEYAQANGPLDSLMIGLDFEAFIRSEPQTRSGFEEPRMVRQAEDLASPRFKLQLAKDVADTLLSLPGFVRSLTALAGTGDAGRRYYRDGAWETTSDSLTGRPGYVYIGKSTIYAIRNEQLDLDSNFEVFADILRYVHQQNIETRIFITPEHVYLIDLWWRLGYGDMWTEFHRRLISVNNSVALEMGVEPFPLFGFNQARGVVDEPIRALRNSTNSSFTDGVHTRAHLGQQIMAAVWGNVDGLGVELNDDSVGEYLSEVERLRLEFEAANTEVTEALRRAVSPELE